SSCACVIAVVLAGGVWRATAVAAAAVHSSSGTMAIVVLVMRRIVLDRAPVLCALRLPLLRSTLSRSSVRVIEFWTRINRRRCCAGLQIDLVQGCDRLPIDSSRWKNCFPGPNVECVEHPLRGTIITTRSSLPLMTVLATRIWNSSAPLGGVAVWSCHTY